MSEEPPILVDLDDVLAAEADAQEALAGGADYVEGISAFMEERSPTFRGH